MNDRDLAEHLVDLNATYPQPNEDVYKTEILRLLTEVQLLQEAMEEILRSSRKPSHTHADNAMAHPFYEAEWECGARAREALNALEVLRGGS